MGSNKKEEIEVYRAGEYFDESKAKKVDFGPVTIPDIMTVLVGANAVPIAVAFTAVGDIMTGGLIAGSATVVSLLTATWGNSERLKYKLGQMNPAFRSLPKGSGKTMIPFLGKRIFPMEFRIESMEPRIPESINRSLQSQDPRNMVSRAYIVKTVKGKVKVAPANSMDAMESWDKLFKQETGKVIDEFRPNSKYIYDKLESRKILDIASAKIRVTLDKGQGKDTPVWIQELASEKLY
jgi:hypothetical protein